jgi:hypothetical protein
MGVGWASIASNGAEKIPGFGFSFAGEIRNVETVGSDCDAVFWGDGHAELHVVGDTADELWEECGVRCVIVDGGL